MGFFERVGLVERIPESTDYIDEVDTCDLIDAEVENVDISGIDNANVVQGIYENNSLFDFSESIFKAEEIIYKFPKEMPSETKRKTVISVLESFGLSSAQVTQDGDRRINILNSAGKKIQDEGETYILERNGLIEDHKKEIERLEKEISVKRDKMKKANKEICSEVFRITEIINFIEGK